MAALHGASACSAGPQEIRINELTSTAKEGRIRFLMEILMK
jgi:hypothetical protein